MEYKSPTDIASFTIDWTNELGGSTVATSDWVVQSGITSDSESSATFSATITLSGGTAGVTYDLENTVTSPAGETFAKHFYVRVREQLVG